MFYVLLFFLTVFYHPFALAKYQVCSITINSADEIQTFKQFLPPSDFHFVELLPAKINPAKDHSTYWFDEVCKTTHHCDILVISGHFGGTFFGESSYALPTELLEEKACHNECQGILSNVKEIFLFGCNTLASKKKDTRTPRQYLQILLDDNLARETAERVVAARYSPLGTPFHARMNFTFSDSNTIYGFDAVSPLGKNIRRPLRKYFQTINRVFGSYTNYLRTKQYERTRNTELFQHLPNPTYTLNQAHLSLSSENPEKRAFFQSKCLLYDNNTNKLPLKMQALRYMFETKQSGFAFFAIDYFLNYNWKAVTGGSGRRIFRSIRNNPVFAKDFVSYYEHLNYLPYVRIGYLNVLEKFQWIDPMLLHIRRKEALLELIKKPDIEAYTTLILLLKNNQIKPGKFYISKKDLPDNYIQSVLGLLIFQKLKVSAPDWQKDILKNCKKDVHKTSALCYQSLDTLAHIGPHLKIAQTAVEFLNYGDDGLTVYTLRMLGQSGIEDYHVHKKISSFLTHSDFGVRDEALEALGFLQTPYMDVHADITWLLPHASPQLTDKIFESLNRMNVRGGLAQKQIIDYAFQRAGNKNSVKKAFSALQNFSDFSDFALSFFYKHLESRDDPYRLLLIIETIVKNQKIKDLGIHYRLMQFYKEESDQLKQKVLEKMVSLTWMHPEVQISFLNYMYDDNPKVRRLAASVLKNIKNLQPKTLHQIEVLYKEEKIEELSVFFSP